MIINENPKHDVSKAQMENVEKEKQEYKIVGTFLRRRGLQLFAYNHLKDELMQVVINKKETLHLTVTESGLSYQDKGHEKANINSNNTHFEALNTGTARNRLNRFKAGKIKELCNLRKPGKGIKFFD